MTEYENQQLTRLLLLYAPNKINVFKVLVNDKSRCKFLQLKSCQDMFQITAFLLTVEKYNVCMFIFLTKKFEPFFHSKRYYCATHTFRRRHTCLQTAKLMQLFAICDAVYFKSIFLNITTSLQQMYETLYDVIWRRVSNRLLDN